MDETLSNCEPIVFVGAILHWWLSGFLAGDCQCRRDENASTPHAAFYPAKPGLETSNE